MVKNTVSLITKTPSIGYLSEDEQANDEGKGGINEGGKCRYWQRRGRTMLATDGSRGYINEEKTTVTTKERRQ